MIILKMNNSCVCDCSGASASYYNWTYSGNFVLCLSGDYIILLFIALPIYISCWYVISHTHMNVQLHVLTYCTMMSLF